MTSSAPSRRRLEFELDGLDLNRLARPALAIAVLASALLIYHLTRGSSFLADDWTWIDTRRGNSLNAFLAPYNGHLSLVPIAIYRLMFAVVGTGDFTPYRILMLVVASVVGVVIFEYARHRIGEFCALLVATLLLFLGPGWNDIMQPFQIAWLIAVASGILALSLLDRRRPTTDAAACLLVLISISSTSVGVAFAVGIAVDIALARRRWRDAWIVGLPLLLYVAWAIHYHPAHLHLSLITSWPANLAQTTAASMAGVVGLSGNTLTNMTGLALTVGVPLLVLAGVAAIVRAGTDWDWTRFVSLATALATFSLMTTVARYFESPFESRYIYVICVLEALMVVELAHGRRAALRVQLGLAALTLVAVVSNVGVLRSGGSYFRQLGTQTDATLAAVDLDRYRVAPDAPLKLPFYPLLNVTAAQYFKTEAALGTPAYTVAELERSNAGAQGAADAQSLSDGNVEFTGVGGRSLPRGTPAPIEAAGGGSAARHGACVALLPAAALPPGQAGTLALQLNPGRVSVSAGRAPVDVSVRRFAPAFTSLGTLKTRRSAIVSIYQDRAPQPWHLQVSSIAPVRVCTVGP